MDNIPENNLFEITLSREGAGWLLRLYKITRWLLILGIIVSLLLVLSLILRYRIYMRYNIPYNWITNVELNILPIFEGVLMVVTIIQLYYFFTFSRTAQKAIEQQQSDLFNESFKWLLRNTLLATVMIAMHFISVGFAVYAQSMTLINRQ